MRKILLVVAVLVATYTVLLGGLFFAMCREPETFSAVMAKTPDIVFLVFPFKPMWLYAREGNILVGEQAPDFTLERFDKTATVRLSEFRGQRPVVLVFGSYTWPPFRREVPALNSVYKQYEDRVEFFIVYIQEAHASDAWQTDSNEKEKVVFEEPRDFETRASLAGTCSANLGVEFPALVDTMDNRTERAYTAWPDRIYIVDRDGNIAYKSEAGPFGFHAEHLAGALEQLVPPNAASDQ
jgi:peroxiredoxin